MTADARYVITNPGSMPWLAMLASDFADAGVLRRYVVSFSDWLPSAQRLVRTSQVMPALARTIQRELGKRPIPPSIPRGVVAHEAAGWEVLYSLAWRTPVGDGVRARLASRRSAAFDIQASHHIESGDTAVIATQTAALATLRRAHGVGAQGILDCPIAYYRYAEQLLGSELREVPDFAGTMQFHRVAEGYRRRVDAEISAATRIVVYTDLMADTFEQFGVDRRKMIVSPLGVDLTAFRPEPRDDDGVFRVFFAGQITQRKGLSYLLESFRLADLDRAELLLVGRPVGDAARHVSRPKVVHHSHVPLWKLPEFYRSADVFVFPTLIEGMPQTVLMAMASGLPVIVSENAFGRNVLRDGREAYVVPIRDTTAIVERLRELHSNPDLRAEMGRAARRRAEEFSWAAFARRVREAIE